KLGLRLENTDLGTFLEQTEQSNNRNYTNLFPSAHTSYKISDLVSLQAGYSRRIFRPNMWLLNPFFNVRNNFNIRTGNPNLDPEFTDSYELTSIYVFEKVSLNLGVYYRYTTDIIERVSLFEDDVNITKPLNVGTDRTTGLELNFKYSPVNWLTVNGDANYQYFSQEGSFEGTVFDFSAGQGFGKLTTKVKLPADFEVEVMGNYQSSYQTIQGEISQMIFANVGVRKKIMKGRGIFNLSVRDIFASRIKEINIRQPEFELYNRGLRGRFVTIGFSYGFGKGEAMQFSGQKQF
ncbi:MAG: outer membrane beta-barrel family protein, partial [Bacteroidota bacterium]